MHGRKIVRQCLTCPPMSRIMTRLAKMTGMPQHHIFMKSSIFWISLIFLDLTKCWMSEKEIMNVH